MSDFLQVVNRDDSSKLLSFLDNRVLYAILAIDGNSNRCIPTHQNALDVASGALIKNRGARKFKFSDIYGIWWPISHTSHGTKSTIKVMRPPNTRLLEPQKFDFMKDLSVVKFNMHAFMVNVKDHENSKRSTTKRCSDERFYSCIYIHPFINNGRTRRPLTPIKYIEST